MLDAELKTQLKSYLENVRNSITLRLTVSDDEASQKMKQLGEDIASLSEKVDISFDGMAARTPSMEILSGEKGSVLTFSGIPLGHEFTSLVLALLHSGGHPMKVDEELIEQVRSLDGDYVFESFISLSCQTCPDVVQALNMMSVINPKIKATMVDGALFQDEIEAKNIQAVPSVFLNGESFGQGRMTLQDIVNKLDANADKRAAEKLAKKDEFDMLIIGGGPAGASAAIYSARKGFNTGILSERFGGQVADTVGIENFISVSYTEGPKLVASLEQHVSDYDVDVMNSQRVKTIEKGDGFTVTTESGGHLKAKSIVLATGARWRKMNVPGEKEYSGKGVAYCPHCDGPLFKGKRVAVIGGGNSGIEAAIDLANIVEHVTVLEFGDMLRADEVLQRKAKSMSNIDIIMQAQTTEVLGDGHRVKGLRYTDRTDGSSHEIELAGIFVQIGLVPNSEFLKGFVDLTERGEIIVSDRGETSVAGIFAAGDVTTVPYKQIIIAMGEGSKAALGAFDYLMRLEPAKKESTEQSKASEAA